MTSASRSGRRGGGSAGLGPLFEKKGLGKAKSGGTTLQLTPVDAEEQSATQEEAASAASAVQDVPETIVAATPPTPATQPVEPEPVSTPSPAPEEQKAPDPVPAPVREQPQPAMVLMQQPPVPEPIQQQTPQVPQGQPTPQASAGGYGYQAQPPGYPAGAYSQPVYYPPAMQQYAAQAVPQPGQYAPQQQAPEPKPAKEKTVRKASYYEPIDLGKRMRRAYNATKYVEGHDSLSDFICRLIEQECQRLEDLYNEGQPFEGDNAVPKGRPVRP